MTQSLIDRIRSQNTGRQPTKSRGGWASTGSFNNLYSPAVRDRELLDRKYDLALAYLYVEPVRAAIDLYAQTVADIPTELVRYDRNERTGRYDETVVASTADPAESRHRFIDLMREHKREYNIGYIAAQVYEAMLYDEIAIELLRPEDPMLRETSRTLNYANGLRVLRGAALTIESWDSEIKRFHYSDSYDSKSLDPRDVAYDKGYHPLDDYRGASRILSVLDETNILNGLRRFLIRTLNKADRPDVFGSPDSEFGGRPDVANRIREDIERYKRDPNATLYIGNVPLRFSTVPAPDLNNQMEVSPETRKSIYRAFNVPMVLVGDSTATGYQDAPYAMPNFVQNQLSPLLNTIYELNNATVLPAFGLPGNYKLRPDLSAFDVLTPDQKARLEVANDDFDKGRITLGQWGEETGNEVDDALKNWRKLDNVLVPPEALGVAWKHKFQVAEPMQEPGEDENVPAAALLPPQGRYKGESQVAYKATPPPQTTFERMQYNGVTFYGSPVQDSERKNSKYMRYVHEGDKEDTTAVHWGQPGEQMERDNPDARANFESRHSCSEKKDPRSAGFQACWAWQPDAPVRSVADDAYVTPGVRDELFTWQRMAKNRIKAGKPEDAADFDSDILPPLLRATVRGALKAGVNLDNIEAVFDDALAWCDHA